ncbi:MAG: DUF4321 domain-containing protein [Candidatus Firestonebacteria bacterium]
MAEGKSFWFYLMVVLVGVVLGSVLGQVVGKLLPQGNMVHDLFVKGYDIGLSTDSPMDIDMAFMKIKLGLTLKLTLSSVVGFVLALFLMRKI